MPPRTVATDFRLGKLLRSARLEANLSVRQLAEHMGVSPATVSKAESGRNPRRSTLNAYLEALPRLSAYAVLQASGHCAPAANAAAWGFYRDAFGLSAKSVSVETHRAARSWCTEVEVRGVRSHRGTLRDPIERTALLRLVAGSSAWLSRELLSLEDKQPRGTVRFDEDGIEHAFVFPSDLDLKGFTYRSTSSARSLPGEGRPGPPSPFVEGISWAAVLPTETLRLSLTHRTAEGLDAPTARVWVNGEAVVPEDPDITQTIHPFGLGCRYVPSANRSEIVVEQPLMNMSYGLGWADAS